MGFMAIPPPRGLRVLVDSYEGKGQAPVRFRVRSWEFALADSKPGITELLSDDRYTRSCIRELRFDAIGSAESTLWRLRYSLTPIIGRNGPETTPAVRPAVRLRVGVHANLIPDVVIDGELVPANSDAYHGGAVYLSGSSAPR
jgi:hypothetical protein